MALATEIPAELRARPFTTAQAMDAGLSRKVLNGRRFQLVIPGRGVWAIREATRDLDFWLAADRLMLPSDAAVSYRTGLLVHGAPVADGPRHWTTTGDSKTRLPVVLHRRLDQPVTSVRGLPVLTPLQCLLDAALIVSPLELIRAGDALIAAESVSLEQLRTVHSAHGAKGLRAAARLMRVGSRSPRESSTRVAMAISGLPEPELNVDIHDDRGTFLGCADFAFRQWRVLVEYDGWYHERDAQQRQYDILREAGLRRQRLTIVTLTSRDHAQPARLVHRVWQALADGGYRGPRPAFVRVAWDRLLRSP